MENVQFNFEKEVWHHRCRGQDEFTGKIFRISHLGYYDELDIITVLAAIERTLVRLQIQNQTGSGCPGRAGIFHFQQRIKIVPMKILIADSVDKQCIDILKKEGFEVVDRSGSSAENIIKEIATADGLIVRSQTKVTPQMLEAAPMLKVVGRAGAGVDNIDVPAATRRGVLVMNTPGGNTISTAEHTMSLMLSLARNIPQANQSLREGKWDRKSFSGVELFEKTLGIVGLGKVGTEVARRSLALGMTVIAFDPIHSAESAGKMGIELVGLDQIFNRSDFITIHSPLTPETKDLINEKTLSRCKQGVRIINCVCGGIVNEHDLLRALENGHVAGAALDVFEEEPPRDRSLILHPRVVTTPHLGASTEEAQEKVALQVAHQIADFLKERGVTDAGQR